jgi:microcompartment protein CcmL/EutN
VQYSERLGSGTDPRRAEPSIGLIETTSVARGYEVADAVVKVSPVELLWARTVSPGHFVVLFAGDVAEVEAGLQRGVEVAGDVLHDAMQIPNVHMDLIPSIRGPRRVAIEEALGIVECTGVATTVLAADAAIKTAYVDLVEVRLAMHLGGKGFFLVAGETADVEAAVAVAADIAKARSAHVSDVVIPRVTPELLEHLS